MRSVWQLLTSFTSSAASREDTRTTRGVTRAKRAAAASALASSSPPTTCGSCSSSRRDRKSTRLNSSHGYISYAVFCLKKKKNRRTVHVVLDRSGPGLADHIPVVHVDY